MTAAIASNNIVSNYKCQSTVSTSFDTGYRGKDTTKKANPYSAKPVCCLSSCTQTKSSGSRSISMTEM